MNAQSNAMHHLAAIVRSILDRFQSDKFVESSIDLNGDNKLMLLNRSFFSTLTGQTEELDKVVEELRDLPEYQSFLSFYLDGLELIHKELKELVQNDSVFSKVLEEVSGWCQSKEQKTNLSDMAGQTWKVFFPEATGIFEDTEQAITTLRVCVIFFCSF